MSDGKVVFDITGNLSGINSALNAATNTIARDTAKWTVLGQTAVNGLVSAAKAGFNGIKALWDNAFEYNASMQTYEVNFKTLLGSAEAAQAKVIELREYAAKTPFTFKDLAQATEMLLGFQLTNEEASLALKHLGDISLGDANKLQSLTLAFGQISSTGKLMGQDLLQMINAGFNPLNVIAEKTGVAYADLKAVMSGEKTSEDFNLRMEAARKEVEELGTGASESAIMLARIGKDGMISADMVAAAMRIATSEGGLFFNALESASQTATGQIATIGDSWDMLTGKITGGVFDKLSQEAFPKVIEWLDELNAAYDKDGWAGLKGAAGGIFDEIGTLAFNAGAGLLTQLYNGITGDTKTTEEVKAYLSEIFGAASDAVDNIKDAGVGFLEWVKDNGELVGAAATTIGIGLGVFAMLSNPLTTVLTALAAALVLFTTDWETFEAKYPNIVASFESLTGIDFSTFVASVQSAKDNLSSFYNDVLAPLFTWLSENGAAVQGILFGIGAAMAFMGAPVAGIALMAGVVIVNWNDIKAAVESAVTAVDTFFTQTIPEAWNQFVADVKTAWNNNVVTPIDNAATAIAEFFGIKVPQDWSLTKSISDAWADVLKVINDIIEGVKWLLGIENPVQSAQKNGAIVTYTAPDAADAYAGQFSGWSDESKDAARQYAQYYREYEQGNKERFSAMEDCLRKIAMNESSDSAYEFQNAFEALAAQFEEGTVELPVSWFEGAEASLQSELDGMSFSTTVDATLIPRLSALALSRLNLPDGWTGTDHASGGIFNAATRFLGMHTFGESGAEALLPLDTLWRKMGLIFDQAFSSNLDAMQYNIMPPIPAASPAAYDQGDLSETIAAAIREAMSNLTVEMDKRTVGRILKPVISQEIADDVNNRRWTS